MSEPASQITEYFLGIEGEQKGPFSKEEVHAMLTRGEISDDTPVWFSGMADWITLRETELFRSAQEETAPPESLLESKKLKEYQPENRLRPFPNEPPPSAVDKITKPFESSHNQTVFSDSVAFKETGTPVKTGNQNILLGALVFVLVGASIVYFTSGEKKVSQKVSKGSLKISPDKQRAIKLSQMQSAFNKSPTQGVAGLVELVKENSSDNVGLEALETLLSYYRRQQMFSDAGSILLTAKKPVEALAYFLKDPPDYAQAEIAYEEAYKQSKSADRREFLIKQIELLIGQLGNVDKAIERIKELDREFPGIPHPFHYYLKTTEQRLSDMFSRVSFYYLDTLNSFIAGELAQITFDGKPLIQITKDKNNKHRIVAVQKSGISLRNDPIPNAYFIFWLANGQWVIADTNLTKERAAFAVIERKKHDNEVMSSQEMLQTLEGVFRTQFPGKGLHELVTPPKRQPLGSVD